MLSVRVLRGINLRKVQFLFPQDPYVEGEILRKHEDSSCAFTTSFPHTKTVYGGGRNPEWKSKNELKFEVKELGEMLELRCLDKEFTKRSREIGIGRLSLAEFDEDGLDNAIVRIAIYHNNEEAGVLECKISYEPPIVSNNPPAAVLLANNGGGSLLPTQQSSLQETEEPSSFSTRSRNILAKKYSEPASIGFYVKFVLVFFVVLFLLIIAPLFYFVFTRSYGYTIYPILGYVIFPYFIFAFLPTGLARFATAMLKYFVPATVKINFGAIHLNFWLRDFTYLKFRVTVEDFVMSNPIGQGFEQNFLTASKVECQGSVEFAHLWRAITLDFEKHPLKKTPDFKRLIHFQMRRLEVSDFTIDFQVSKQTGRLNINEITRSFAAGEMREFLQREARLNKRNRYYWPNMFEIKIIRGRDLLAADANGLSDPYVVVTLRKEKQKTIVKKKTLKPMWDEKIFQFPLTDPSTVIHVCVWDEDLFKASDFLGQWLMTAKWVIMDHTHCKHTSIGKEEPPESSRFWTNGDEFHESWINGWFPLLDSKFSKGSLGKCGELNMQFRWRYDEALDKERRAMKQIGEEELLSEWLDPSSIGEKAVSSSTFFSPSSITGVGGEMLSVMESTKALKQIEENTKETRLRLGDVPNLINTLDHVPLLFDIQLVMIRDAKISIADLFMGKVKSTKRGGKDGGEEGPEEEEDSREVAEEPEKPVLDEEEDDDDFNEDLDEVLLTNNNRPFVRVPTIEWMGQFRPRHGDSGITVYKVLDRFFRGLAPKLARHRKLNMKLLGQINSGLFSSALQDLTSVRGWVEKGSAIAHNLKGANLQLSKQILGTAKMVKDVMLRVENVTHEGSDFIVPVQADCEDILLPSPKLSGKLLVSFSGKNIPKHANASMRWFGKERTSWDLWHFELKGTTFFFKRSTIVSKWKICNIYLAESLSGSVGNFGGGGSQKLQRMFESTNENESFSDIPEASLFFPSGCVMHLCEYNEANQNSMKKSKFFFAEQLGYIEALEDAAKPKQATLVDWVEAFKEMRMKRIEDGLHNE